MHICIQYMFLLHLKIAFQSYKYRYLHIKNELRFGDKTALWCYINYFFIIILFDKVFFLLLLWYFWFPIKQIYRQVTSDRKKILLKLNESKCRWKCNEKLLLLWVRVSNWTVVNRMICELWKISENTTFFFGIRMKNSCCHLIYMLWNNIFHCGFFY